MSLRLILSLAIAALAVIFTLYNYEPVPVKFAVWEFKSPLALVIALTLILGAAAAALVAAPSALRKSWKLSREERHSAELNARIAELEQAIAAKDRRIRELEARVGATATSV
ncbi:MAG: lipopolysaccharide assembly protein LapA domain-containing protein [Betaproteobacteria bacterium]|nr:lipopolysaccharide assembly protein LapA domain-containing protein [Betaproteobacteria bacterium]